MQRETRARATREQRRVVQTHHVSTFQKVYTTSRYNKLTVRGAELRNVLSLVSHRGQPHNITQVVSCVVPLPKSEREQLQPSGCRGAEDTLSCSRRIVYFIRDLPYRNNKKNMPGEGVRMEIAIILKL